MIADKIPATVVTGFLGAGKTTLISNLIRQADGRRIALIVNEFGTLGVDGGLIAECGIEGCTEDDVIELANGCICCTVADDFVPAIEKLLARDPAPNHIIIETSGLALPQPLVQAFQWPAVKDRVTVDGVVTVADAAALSEGRVASDLEAVAAQRAADDAVDHETPVEELFADQLRCADMIVLSKTDLVPARALGELNSHIGARARGGVQIIPAVSGEIPAAVLLGLGSAAEDNMAGREASHHHHHHDDDHDHDHHDHDHHHHHDHDHGHDAFDSFVLPLAPVPNVFELKNRVLAAMAVPGVLRIKGRARVAEKTAPLVVHNLFIGQG